MSRRIFPYSYLIQKESYYLILLALITAIAGEFKLIPFGEEDIRFGLGTITFFLLILIRMPQSLIRAGFITGWTVVLFRLLLDIVFYNVDISSSLQNHLSAGLFYFLFAIGLSLIDIEKYKNNPLLLGFFATGFEIISNTTEQFVRSLLLQSSFLSFQEWLILCGIALLRSYFVVGLYSTITIREQEERIREMLEVGSELYAETLYLQKSMDHIERITASSYDLYRKLNEENMNHLGKQALYIAQEIHEVKKDSQRIYSGLSKITSKRKDQVYLLSELVELVMTANKKYSQLLKKDIQFNFLHDIDYETNQHIALLALLNNVMANAVEAIDESGSIEIQIYEDSGNTYFEMKDSGKGIPEEDKKLVFEPGFTTKFNDKGVAATGIGLSHVREIVETLDGHIEIESQQIGTIFRIDIPTHNIRK